ncbi:hypothetical protein XENTR_v10002108 [Xenopus tropicalis]|uniref:NEDD4-binding protein 1 n=1 Tax=Xenopus tropicalis TaxID=8364 RepID=F7AN73_XENTR|nr:protein KHNYN [Xenopus tropicalis]KAE8633823.1 hypothetical protein XENTR_v10002108 [Xenopus tropicalis]KAE8633824.1 hypothetical protein XENTR_v10002108 [Xenopus tropicalis]
MFMEGGEHEAAQDDFSVDEFTVPQESEKEIQDQQPHVERIFGVSLNIIGVLDQPPLYHQPVGHLQMWLQMRGDRRSIGKAKDYIKGLCTPEITEDFDYPREMHCIFVGAKGLFLDCLIRDTSAYVKPLTPGRIRISGLAEGAVMAQSWVCASVEKCKSNTKPNVNEVQIKRHFKDLVEDPTDKHALDLLILPTSVKEELLSLVGKRLLVDSAAITELKDQHRMPENTNDTTHVQQFWPTEGHKNQRYEKSISSKLDVRCKSKPSNVILHHRASEPLHLATNNEWDCSSQEPQIPNLDTYERPMVQITGIDLPQFQHVGERELQYKDDHEEFQQISGLLDTIMGRENGDQKHFSLGTQKEFNMLLDFFKTMGYQEAAVLKVLSENGIQEPSQILDKVKLEQSNTSQRTESQNVNVPYKDLSHTASSQNDEDDDYVLEVVKSAAKNCGYCPSEIVDIGNGSVAGLLRKLNEKNILEDQMAFSNYQNQDDTEGVKLFSDVLKLEQVSELNTVEVNPSDKLIRNKHCNHPVEDLYPGVAQQEVGLLEKGKGPAEEKEPCVPVVTGIQRFNEAMQTPFQLNLRNEKGNEELRYIIIDGSNVAMIHGLHRFFSCRGIALAVQYFWDRGHRGITVFVPQWRMKKDSKVKEQHFLTELNDLGLLSFTPSRTIEGKRVTSYDDRFMLQLAEKTDGVIVTNDNLRDIAAESQAWKTIIKDRLLQYTFVGDIFMVPDDPLGRNGPPLNQFLSKNLRPRTKSKGHSFAGRRGTHSAPKKSSQTEVLNFRDRKAGAVLEERKADVRSFNETQRLRHELLNIFPSQDSKVDYILHREPYLSDLNKLSELIITLKC